MKRWIGILAIILCGQALNAQGLLKGSFKRYFSKQAVTGQFAGSTGFWTVGYSRVSSRERLELGLLYGKVPRRYGGILRTITLKLTYNPFKIYLLPKLRWEPLQTGLFSAQSFGTNVGMSWPDKYPQGYYWWPRGLREHVFLGSQLSWCIKDKPVDRVSVYFEANTNDLYIYSFVSNTKALKLYDIIFFGIGAKVYFH